MYGIHPSVSRLYKRLILQGFFAIIRSINLLMESRPNQHRPTHDQRGVPESGQQRPGNNAADIQIPQSSITTQTDRKAERADKKAARKKEGEQERREKRAKAEQFRETHKGTSLAKAHLEHDFD